MTKSQRSVTKKLQLAKLFRWLAILCFIKLAIFAMILLDLPFPALLDKTASNDTVPEIKQGASTAPKDIPRTEDPGSLEQAVSQPVTPPMPLPQGADAARLAKQMQAKSKTRTQKTPVPVLATEEKSKTRADEPVFQPQDKNLPKPLPAPIAEPGVERKQVVVAENTLPVPTLGAVTAARAAASMPVPETPGEPAQSPFSPIEQQSPLTLPGAPEIPDNIPRGGQGENLLPPRESTSMPTPDMTKPVPHSSLQRDSETQELVRQQQEMLMLKKQMDERLQDLHDSEAKVKRMLDEAHGVEAKKIKGLVQMYANMKPKTAAKALEKMDERTACQILQGMTAKQSGDILSYTNPTVTAKLTEILTRMQIE